MAKSGNKPLIDHKWTANAVFMPNLIDWIATAFPRIQAIGAVDHPGGD